MTFSFYSSYAIAFRTKKSLPFYCRGCQKTSKVEGEQEMLRYAAELLKTTYIVLTHKWFMSTCCLYKQNLDLSGISQNYRHIAVLHIHLIKEVTS